MKTKSIERGKRDLAGHVKPEIPQPIKETAAFYYTECKEKNAHESAAKKFRKSLLGLMKGAGLNSCTVTVPVQGKIEERDGKPVMIGGTPTALNITVGQNEKKVVNIAKLAKKVDTKTLLLIVSATQKAVLAHVPDSVLQQCLDVDYGEENVDVEAV
jgi:hypothetical protein